VIGAVLEGVLIARVGAVRCALRIEHVVETLRPLTTQPLGGVPACVRGLAVIRGVPTVVVDTGVLVGLSGDATTRWVVVRAGERRVALTFDEVFAVSLIAPDAFASLPPLLADSAARGVSAIGRLDDALLVVIDAARVVPPEVWGVGQA